MKLLPERFVTLTCVLVQVYREWTDGKGNPHKLYELSEVIGQVLGLFFLLKTLLRCILDILAACLIPQWMHHGADGGDNETEISTQWWSRITSIASTL